MKTTITGYPRIGKNRELKFAVEAYWKKELSREELEQTAKQLRKEQWLLQKDCLDQLPVNTFSYYDGMLDTAWMLNAVSKEYQKLALDELDTYFAMARGYQGVQGDVKALSMKKWFNTNYHYLVPELQDDMKLELHAEKLLQEYTEAAEYGISGRPAVIGPFTFLKLAKRQGRKTLEQYAQEITEVYVELLHMCAKHDILWLQLDEPSLVCDLTEDDVQLFTAIYTKLLAEKQQLKLLLQTYFGDIRDSYETVIRLPFDGIGLDFVEGTKTAELLQKHGFPKTTVLYAGLVNGKNIWKSSYEQLLQDIEKLRAYTASVVLTTSCSLLHVPYTLQGEQQLSADILQHFAYAQEKLLELKELGELAESADYRNHEAYTTHEAVFRKPRTMADAAVQKRVAQLKEQDYIRDGKRTQRQQLQKEKLQLPLLPVTTIGSFPQTAEVKRNRTQRRKGLISKETYEARIQDFVMDCIRLQEELGLDVLVHGEYERNDMVEYFGEQLSGFVFTEKAWVQSYGTRCVKPPVIFGDVRRDQPMTVAAITYAQSLTDLPVKGMLSGPVTILNWSFPREDISRRQITEQIALAIQDEVNDLEQAGISIIQIDEAALREKLPLRKQDWHREYLDWAIPCFRLCCSKLSQTTQIHTHMCYSEFDDIIKEIDAMDADVITFEASRSKLTLLDTLRTSSFETEVGPGVYDIHSPRVPSVKELCDTIALMLEKVAADKLWINPDCGLKTRGVPETVESLKNMKEATAILRGRLKGV